MVVHRVCLQALGQGIEMRPRVDQTTPQIDLFFEHTLPIRRGDAHDPGRSAHDHMRDLGRHLPVEVGVDVSDVPKRRVLQIVRAGHDQAVSQVDSGLAVIPEPNIEIGEQVIRPVAQRFAGGLDADEGRRIVHGSLSTPTRWWRGAWR